MHGVYVIDITDDCSYVCASSSLHSAIDLMNTGLRELRQESQLSAQREPFSYHFFPIAMSENEQDAEIRILQKLKQASSSSCYLSTLSSLEQMAKGTWPPNMNHSASSSSLEVRPVDETIFLVSL